MKKRIILCALFCLISIGISKQIALAKWHTPPDKWEKPRTFHADFDKDFENRIKISHINLSENVANIEEAIKNYSRNDAYWFVVNLPDTMKPCPWLAQLIVFNERDYFIKIELKDYHATYTPTTKWINEKLLYVQLWWGRVLGTYFIFDVEKEEIIIKEMVWDGNTPFQQFQEKKSK